MMNKWISFLLLSLVLLLGFSLRWYDLGTESLWIDEAFSVHHASISSVSEVITEVSITEGAPPGYYLLLHYWIALVGTSEIAVRSLSVLFGVLSIIVLFFLVRLFFSVSVALLSSLFLATSMLQVLFSQEARLYSMFTFLTIAGSYLLALLFLREEKIKVGNKRPLLLWVMYFIAMVVTFYVNYVAFFVVLLYFIVLFVRWEFVSVTFRSMFLSVHIFLVVVAIGLYYFSGNVLFRQFTSLNKGLTESLIAKHLPSFLAQLGLFFYTLPLLLSVLFLFVIVRYWKNKKKNILNEQGRMFQKYTFSDSSFFSVIIFWAVGYIYLCFHTLTLFGIPVTQNPITESYFLIRHSFFLAPLLYVFVAYKISTMRQKVFAGGVIFVILLVNAVALSAYYSQTTKAPWREAMDYIQETSVQPSLLLLDKGGFSNEYLLRYYYRSEFGLIKLTVAEGRQLIQMSEEELWTEIDGREEVWLILYKNTKTKDYYKKIVDIRYVVDRELDFGDIKVYHYHTRNI